MTSKFFLDAGTTYSKIIEISGTNNPEPFALPFFKKPEATIPEEYLVEKTFNKKYYILPSKLLKKLNIKFEKTCGHMSGENHENEIIALAKASESLSVENATILDLGSRDAKWIKFNNGKFKDMDWNTSCASSTGATVEMLLKFYDVTTEELAFSEQKFPVTCGIFGLEKIMDDVSKGEEASDAISKFIHGIAYNAWSFCKKPEKIYLSGGFCDNKCFVRSLRNYCEVKLLGRFFLAQGLVYLSQEDKSKKIGEILDEE